MFKKLTSILGDANERELKKLQPLVSRINSLEPKFERLSGPELRDKATEFKGRLAAGESLDSLLPEAFAAVREAAKRTIGERHFDVQLMGGIVLHQGKIAEMKTGEGKTLVATLPVYLNSLTDKGVHIVTVNDYLARRDTHWMGPIYHALGVSVGCIQHEAAFLFNPEYDSGDPIWRHLQPVPRRQAYEADVTYGTNNEFGFDYLRDNMVADLSQCVQRELSYAIVDEIDNILIDESRTPLIISGQAEEPTQNYYTFARLVPRLRQGEDYQIDEKLRTPTLTELGISKLEKWMGVSNLYDPQNYHLVHYAENALRAQVFYRRDREYVVKNGEVIIVDEFTGRLMPGRRYSEGLHQAIEAKEGLKVGQENITLASITFQNYFRMYKKLAGMTGTAATEAEEFHKLYNLDVLVIPTNKPLIRYEYPDRIYKTEEAKFRAAAREIAELHKQGRPVLVGTVSVEKSEKLSQMLKHEDIPHQILNAKNHEKEAAIIAQAGRPGTVTISTNMAGRGVDILLGGNPDGLAKEQLSREGFDLSQIPLSEWEDALKLLKQGKDPTTEYPAHWTEVLKRVYALCQRDHQRVVELSGLHVLGTERHEARRIDNQLRGRAGRQGDPGSSQFYVSLEDEIMSRFGGGRLKGFMDLVGFDEDMPIEHSFVSKAIGNAQVKAESYHFDIRKNLLDYDEVLNKQREYIYAERRKILSGGELKSNIQSFIKAELQNIMSLYLSGDPELWDWENFMAATGAILPLPPSFRPENLSGLSQEEIEEKLLSLADELYQEREKELGEENMRLMERLVTLQAIDRRWREHLTEMENERQSVGLYAYAHRDPLISYKKESHEMFQGLLEGVRRDTVQTIYKVSLVRQSESEKKPAATARQSKKIGRNDPCPCGSGKKYKKCCGRYS